MTNLRLQLHLTGANESTLQQFNFTSVQLPAVELKNMHTDSISLCFVEVWNWLIFNHTHQGYHSGNETILCASEIILKNRG